MYKPDLNRTQAIGLVLIFTALAAFFIPSAWVSAYMDSELVETYRGYDIHYLPNANVYGVDIGTEIESWPFDTTIQGSKNRIDNLVDGPETIEQYRGGTIYKLTGYNRYWFEKGDIKTTGWDTLENLKTWVDLEYYPTLVYTIHSSREDFLIYRQGDENPRYWGELGDYSTLDYSRFAKARDAARAHLKEIGEPRPEPDLENPDAVLVDEKAETPPADPGSPDTGNANPDNPADTVGQQLATMKTLVAGVSGSIGVGLFVLGSTKREEE